MFRLPSVVEVESFIADTILLNSSPIVIFVQLKNDKRQMLNLAKNFVFTATAALR